MKKQPKPKNLIEIKIGHTKIHIAPDRDIEYVKAMFMFFHDPAECK